MPRITEEQHLRLKRLLKDMDRERQPWREYWRLIADFVLPRRYVWLMSDNEAERSRRLHNNNVVDGTATQAVQILASGLMNGITSPARPWFRLRVPQYRDNHRVTRWLQSVEEDMLFAMSRTNFYNAMATLFLDLSIFQTASMNIYEDSEDIFRCYNYALGEYYFAQNNRHVIDRFAREFTWRVEQVVREFGLENCSQTVQDAWRRGAEGFNQKVQICHIIEPNGPPYRDIGVPAVLPFREVYWEKAAKAGDILRVRGFNEWPGPAVRWDVSGNDAYGTGPSTEALPDVRQLQHMQKRKLQALDKLISPPVVADIQLQHRPAALMPNGITYVAGVNNVGVKPIYTINPPMDQISQEISRLQQSIQRHYHNDKFYAITQLEGDRRTAAEINFRKEEQLIQLGPFFDRLQREALEPAIKRIFGIMFRARKFAEPPEEIQNVEALVEYDSILSDARRALDAAPIERGAAFVGNLAGAVPDVLDIPDWEETVRDYFTKVGVAAKNVRSREEVAELRQQRQAVQAAQQAAEVAQPLAQSAKLLSETPVGGANDALSVILGNS